MIRLFNFKEDYYDMKEWLAARSIDMPPPDEMPATGFVCIMDDIPTAVGFLRIVEGKQGKIDYLVTNPHQPSETRDAALDEISTALIKLAKDIGLKQIYAHTKCNNTKERSLSKGFQEFPHSLIALDLRPKVQNNG